jgi:hypothetical protein
MVMTFSAVVHSRKVGWSGTPVMSDVLMADDAGEFSSAFNLFQIPGPEDPYDLPALLV